MNALAQSTHNKLLKSDKRMPKTAVVWFVKVQMSSDYSGTQRIDKVASAISHRKLGNKLTS